MSDGQPVAHVAEDGRGHGLEEHLRDTARRAGEFAAVFGGGEWGMSMNAHTPNTKGEWHSLRDHLEQVSALAERFAIKFRAENYARLVGLFHDIGKGNPAFQEYLTRCHELPKQKHHGPDHKGAGAILAASALEPLAFLVAGHHGGLQNRDELGVWLKERLGDWQGKSLEQQVAEIGINRPSNEKLLPPAHVKNGWQAELFLRLLFSCLVDADFLDTEKHFTPERTALRGHSFRLEKLWHSLEAEQRKLAENGQGPLNEARNRIYQECLVAAELEPGFFRLTVPTGGGKTRSGMAFALKHAVSHNKDRVIVAIPFTSIIEQTADVYRQIFGADAVLEHHSAASPPDDEDNADTGVSWARLSAENWDAPIVVTTTVQLFESIFSNKTSRCRKLHNIVNSVIILDEVQTLPSHLLTPILDILNELVTNYRVSVVLCTATQPAVDATPHFKGIVGIREIVAEPEKWFATLKRVDYAWDGVPWTWEQVAETTLSQQQCLTVVNTKKDAFALLDVLDDPAALHLSTNICGAHRRDVLKKVRWHLEKGTPCRLVATQVVEAGVDIDFPVVLRSVGPLDRIVQAAGRCNREGLRETGRMVVFAPAEGSTPPGDYKTGAATALSLMQKEGFDFHDPAIFGDYFRRLYQAVNLDAKGIQPLRERLQFRDTAERFAIIDDDSVPVVVRYRGSDGQSDEVDRLIEGLANGWHDSPMGLVRKLQPYMVNLRRYALSQAERNGLVRQLTPGVWEWLGQYDRVRGIIFGSIDPDKLIV